MLKPGQIKWYNGLRHRIVRVSRLYTAKRDVCLECRCSHGQIPLPCVQANCLRTMPEDCYPKPDPRTPKRL